MNPRLVAPLLVVSVLAAGSAAAQTIAASRAGELASKRQEKAMAPSVTAGDKLERVLDFVERNAFLQHIANPGEGVGVRLGGIESGAGLAAGPMWRTSRPMNGRLQLHASAAVSIARDHEIEAGVAIPEVGTHRLSLRFGAAATRLAQERFFGAGASSQRADETTFALDRRGGGIDAVLEASSWLTIGGGAGLAHFTAADGAARGVPGVSTRWTGESAPGFVAPATFSTVSAAATVDWRDVPGNPRRGGRYHVGIERFSDRSQHAHSFNRLNVELEQHLSWWRRQRTLTLRGVAMMSAPAAGQEVPFYLQPTLGGSRVLRGFVTDRFRDRHMLALQAEYGWDLWPFLGAVVFYEAGTVEHEWRAFSVRGLKSDYGLGFRLGSARTIALRTDVALGSGEGTRLAMRFSHAF
jgi:hypothetical protein